MNQENKLRPSDEKASCIWQAHAGLRHCSHSRSSGDLQPVLPVVSTQLVTGVEGCVILAVNDNLCKWTDSPTQTDAQAYSTNALHCNPLGREPLDLGLDNMHLDWKEDCQGPEADGSQQTHNIIEERQQHGDHCKNTHTKLYANCYAEENNQPGALIWPCMFVIGWL